MSRFFVGQRVRLVRRCDAANFGATGTLVAFEFVPRGTVSSVDGGTNWMDCDCAVDWDDSQDRIGSAESTARLEPLTDPGREVIAWQDCVWKPDHLRSRVEVGP